MKAAGAWVFSGGLHPPSTATVVKTRDGTAVHADGPYIEGREHIGGSTIIRPPIWMWPWNGAASYRLPNPRRCRAPRAHSHRVGGHLFDLQRGLCRHDLRAEAIRLGHRLAELLPEEPEATGLLALMLLIDSRRDASVDAAGELLGLTAQNRERWNRPMIDEAVQLVASCIRQNRPGPYQIQAAINAIHSTAASSASTDWRQIVARAENVMERRFLQRQLDGLLH